MFGKILKEIRNNHNDTVRSLEEKTGVLFSYISKVENGTKNPNKIFVSKMMKAYPLEKKKLLRAYLSDLVPDDHDIQIFKDEENSIKDIHDILFSKVSDEYKKLILNMLVQRIEFESYKKGKLKDDEEEIKKIKEMIEKL
ncbi:helix-turn-helix domain-containing protein [Fusobacterium sp. MFO224]|uniref:helix-turn-helix domain-containing protein n=1 Tax=Fusobacterium sp. MFO224 TaxID=3378070 RepID=UPI0038542A47